MSIHESSLENYNSYFISPVVGVSNGILTIKIKDEIKKIPIIIAGELHGTVERLEDTLLTDNNVVSILDIFEKYVLYNHTSNSKIVFHLESSYVKALYLSQYYEHIDAHKYNTRIIDKLNEFNEIWNSQRDIIVNILSQEDYEAIESNAAKIHAYDAYPDFRYQLDALLNPTIEIINQTINILNRYKQIKDAQNVLRKIKYIFNNIECIYSYIINTHNTFINHMIEHYSQYYDYDYDVDIELEGMFAPDNSNKRMGFLSQVNLIYAGGWLKPLFKHYKISDIKTHLQLVDTITSIIDNVNIYNIDYRDLIIDTLKLNATDYKIDEGYLNSVYDSIVQLQQLTYLDDSDNSSHTIPNPIYILVNKLDDITKDIFKSTFISCILRIDSNANKLDKKRYSTLYYWILDLYSLMQFVYMVNTDPPSILFMTVGFLHKCLHESFLKQYYGDKVTFNTNINNDNCNSYQSLVNNILNLELTCKDFSPHFNKDLLKLNTKYTNDNKFYLDYTLNYSHEKYLLYSNYRNSLISYDFLTEYIVDQNKSNDERETAFKYDIIDNFKEAVSIGSLASYKDEHKNAIIEYIKHKSYLFRDDGPADEKSLTVGGGISVQDPLLYQIQANFAKYYMHVCGFDDPVKLMNGIKMHMYLLNLARSKLIENTSSIVPKSAIGLPVPRAESWQMTNTVPMVPAYGGGALYIVKILLISATVVALILLLCGALAAHISVPPRCNQWLDSRVISVPTPYLASDGMCEN